jgi:hypothetical protein
MTLAFRDGDVQFLFETGVPITLNGTSGVGLVDKNQQVVVSRGGRGDVVSGVTTITVQTSKFNFTIRNGLQIIVDGVVGSVRQLLPENDAALTKFLLGDASGVTVPPPPQVGVIDGGQF